VAKKSLDDSEPKSKRIKLDENTSNILNGKRITFMVNIWLNHCPLESEPLDDELVEKLTTPWEEQEHENSKSNLKAGDPFVPPLQWSVKDITVSDNLDKTASLTGTSKDSEDAAGIDEAVICNRHVDIAFGASMDDFHKASRLAAEEGSMAIKMEDGVFTLKVGKEVSSDEEEDA